MSLSFKAIGLQAFVDRVKGWPAGAEKAVILAINTSMRRARPEASRRIRAQVAFTAGYLNQPKRLFIRSTAARGHLFAELSARRLPTMLARFGKQATRKGKRAGVRVKVKAGGGSKLIRSAFFINLKNGNVGVAVRASVAARMNLKRAGLTAAGSPINGQKEKFVLLFGPSVDQVFRTVKDDMAPGVQEFFSNEFVRQFERLSKKR